MIDWLTIHAYIPHQRIVGERFLRVQPDGEVTADWMKPVTVAGSHSTTVRAETLSYLDNRRGWILRVDGNPSKWFQGHNLTGGEDLPVIVRAFVASVLVALSDPMAAVRATRMRDISNWELKRVDIARMYDVGTSVDDVNTWIKAAERRAWIAYRGRGWIGKGSTLYFMKHSRHWSFKMYAKGNEIKDHPGGLEALDFRTDAVAWAENKMRAEGVFRSPFLRHRGLHTVRAWNQNTAAQVYSWAMGRLQLPENMTMSNSELRELPARLALVVNAWQSGVDIMTDLPRSTAYRYRRQLLEYGIDIASEPADPGDVVALVRVLEACEAVEPEWAKNGRVG